MGFFFRKSVGFGPIRLNFSKSGIGVSAGVKGARISAGPSGTYIHAGRNGFYYRQRVGGSSARTKNEARNYPQEEQIPFQSNSNPYIIQSANVSRLMETSNVEILNQINEALRQTPYFPFALLATFVISFFAFGVLLASPETISFLLRVKMDQTISLVLSFLGLFTTFAIFIVGIIYSLQIRKQDLLKRTTPLFYELENNEAVKFNKIQEACEGLATSKRIWRIQASQPTRDQRRNAGASSLITRTSASVIRQSPPFIATNVDVWGLRLNDSTLFFMPDFVFVFQNGKYGAVSYESLRVSLSPTNFIEGEALPRDAQVVGYSWQYVNNDGSPDRRFSNNRQIPIAEYGLVEFRSQQGVNVHLHVSNLEASKYFAKGFVRDSDHSQTNYSRERSTHTGQNRKQKASYPNSELRTACEVLGVSAESTLDEITTAYRQMAKMYHPDRLASLAPEFMVIAEERMRDINDAYAKLKRQFQ